MAYDLNGRLDGQTECWREFVKLCSGKFLIEYLNVSLQSGKICQFLKTQGWLR